MYPPHGAGQRTRHTTDASLLGSGLSGSGGVADADVSEAAEACGPEDLEDDEEGRAEEGPDDALCDGGRVALEDVVAVELGGPAGGVEGEEGEEEGEGVGGEEEGAAEEVGDGVDEADVGEAEEGGEGRQERVVGGVGEGGERD